MRARTLHQPWASLMAVGLKYIETRGQRTNVRGRVAIHAAATTKGMELLPGDCEGNREGDWRYGYIGDWQVTWCVKTGDEGQRGDTLMVNLSDGQEFSFPFGAVVATGNLVDCIPITASATDGTPTISRHDGPDYPRPVLWQDDGRACWPITDQLPFGDFTPGRWAWIFEDIAALPEPIPARGRQGWWDWVYPRP